MDNLIALFPLNLVLFPGASLPLHIFEPRYRLMINRCVQLEEPFGVVLIRDGEAEGGPVAEPHDTGTTATLQNVIKFPDGRMLLAAVGERRFRINQIVQREPYMVANVEYLEDEVTPEAHALADQARELYIRHAAALSQATGVAQPTAELPSNPSELSFVLSAEFHIVDDSKQQLLEADLDDRLLALVDALERELKFLPPPPRDSLPTYTGPWTLN